jgi:hypothetical protein
MACISLRRPGIRAGLDTAKLSFSLDYWDFPASRFADAYAGWVMLRQ